jgi:hypothetical protein
VCPHRWTLRVLCADGCCSAVDDGCAEYVLVESALRLSLGEAGTESVFAGRRTPLRAAIPERCGFCFAIRKEGLWTMDYGLWTMDR